MPDRFAGLAAATEHIQAFFNTVDERPVAAPPGAGGMGKALGEPVPEHGDDPTAAVDAQVAGAAPRLIGRRASILRRRHRHATSNT
ncbi:MAG: hypothetical protein J2P17_18845 [Mycobacterium sp.]|nr:hypothetical protein [Mycobacterium sp.]